MNRANLRHYLNARYMTAAIVFVALLFSISLGSALLGEMASIQRSLSAQSPQIEDAIRQNDLIRAHKMLWPFLNGRVAAIQIEPVAFPSGKISASAHEKPSGILAHQRFELVSNGLHIANVTYSIDITHTAMTVFIDNVGFYLSLALFAAILMGYANSRTASALSFLEKRIILLARSSHRDGASGGQDIAHLADQIQDGTLSPACAESLKQLILAMDEHSKSRAEFAEANTTYEIAKQVAHDIRSPLSALKIATHGLKGMPTERVSLIRQAADRIQSISDDLLAYARRRSEFEQPAENQTNPSPLPLREIVRDIVKEKQVELSGRTNMVIHSKFFDADELFARVDPGQLQRAVSNIVNNAAEAIHADGHVAIELTRVGDKAIITVSDNGMGIPDEIIPLIGRRGYSHGKCGKGATQGNGLGLFQAKQIAERAGGELRIESRIGIGTKISLLLPLASPSSKGKLQ